MSAQVSGTWWSGRLRALAVLGVLMGVFTMHGLTGNHDVTMTEHAPSVMLPAPVGADRSIVPVDDHEHAADGGCLAMLTALVLLLALTPVLRGFLTRRPAQLALPVERAVLAGRSPPWLAPSLSKLCVSRT